MVAPAKAAGALLATSPYASRRQTKVPGWAGLTAWDVLFNNLSLGLFLVTALGMLVRPAWFASTATAAYIVAFVLVLVDLSLLVVDLGDPPRFTHMLRVAKRESPMSVGTWSLSGYAALLFLVCIVSVAGWEDVTRVLAAVTLIPAAGGVLYKGVLFSATSQAGWRASRWLGALMAESAVLVGAALLLAILVLSHQGGGEGASAVRAALAVLLVLQIATALEVRRDVPGRYGPLAGLVVWIGVLAVGIVVPLELLLLGNLFQIVAALLVVAAAPVLRYALVFLPRDGRKEPS